MPLNSDTFLNQKWKKQMKEGKNKRMEQYFGLVHRLAVEDKKDCEKEFEQILFVKVYFGLAQTYNDTDNHFSNLNIQPHHEERVFMQFMSSLILKSSHLQFLKWSLLE